VATVLRYAGLAMLAMASAWVSAEAVVRLNADAPGVVRAASAEVRAVAAPFTAPPQRANAVLKGSDGHYWADADVDGEPVRFLVDTGATEVALTPRDAQRLGIDTAILHYESSVVTAGGHARAASVRLPSVTVAGARLEDVDALVIEKGLDASLLGMSYLGRLSSFQATRQGLFLKP
jgi:aspartyl protease family protein